MPRPPELPTGSSPHASGLLTFRTVTVFPALFLPCAESAWRKPPRASGSPAGRMMLPPTAQPSSADGQEDSEKIFILVAELTNPEQRESALLELSKRRETFVDLAPILWHSFGTISALLQEIVAIYPLLSPPSLTAQASNRVCNALALLQCVASHPETRTLFLNGATPPIPHSRVCVAPRFAGLPSPSIAPPAPVSPVPHRYSARCNLPAPNDGRPPPPFSCDAARRLHSHRAEARACAGLIRAQPSARQPTYRSSCTPS